VHGGDDDDGDMVIKKVMMPPPGWGNAWMGSRTGPQTGYVVGACSTAVCACV